ncbi:HEAT repeat domain-containing protein [bacterium]|nr:HEAT repeat domain-containing protein [candidate division CSSED10-310 bacterium]
MTETAVKRIFDSIINGSVSERDEAFKQLQQLPFDAIRDFLFDGLRHNHHRIRSTCAQIIGEKGDETVIFQLLQTLSDDSWAIRTSAQEALKYLPEDTVLPVLEGIVSSQAGNIPMVKTLTNVLSSFRRPEASSVLVKLLQLTDDSGVIEAVARALGKREDDLSISHLFHLLAHNQWGVRKTAARAISEMPLRVIQDKIKRELSNPNRFIHLAVIEMLISRGDESVIDLMAEVLSSNNDLTRSNAMNVLAGIGSDDSYSLLISLLGDTSEAIQERAAEIVGKSRSLSVLNLLKRCLKSANNRLRMNAVRTLGLMGTDEAVDVLEELVISETGKTKLAILSALAGIGNRRAIRLVVKNCNMPEYSEQIFDILRQMDSDLAIQQLVNMLDEDGFFQTAVKALADLDRLKVFRSLSTKLGSGTPLQQEKAVETMGLIGSKEAIPYLEKVVEGGFNPKVLSAAQAALLRLRKPAG